MVNLAGENKFILSNALPTSIIWTNAKLNSSRTRTNISRRAEESSTIRKDCEEIPKRRMALLQPLIQSLSSHSSHAPILARTTTTQDVLVTSLRVALFLRLILRGEELLRIDAGKRNNIIYECVTKSITCRQQP